MSALVFMLIHVLPDIESHTLFKSHCKHGMG